MRNRLWFIVIFLTLTASEVAAAMDLPPWISQSLPNSFSLGFSSHQVSFDENKNYTLQNEEQAKVFPAIINSLNVRRIDQAPSFHSSSSSSLDGNISPAFSGFAINQTTHFVRKKSADPTLAGERELSIRLIGACAHLMLNASYSWDVHSIYTGLGFGPCLYSAEYDGSEAKFAETMSTKFLMGYRLFATRTFFISLEADVTLMNHDIYRSEYLEADSVDRATLAFGWYLGQTKAYAFLHKTLKENEGQRKRERMLTAPIYLR